MTVKVHSGLCMKYSRWDIFVNIMMHHPNLDNIELKSG